MTQRDRYEIEHRTTGVIRTTARTRDAARINKRRDERIFDVVNNRYVR